MRPQSRNGFETAIICALPLEFDAVEALFDETYDEFGANVYGKRQGDPNWYRTGRIGTHNVVLTCLPEMGKASAASVASNLQVSFPRVTLGLLVGICGAVPFPSEQTEIILGDVIVSDKVVEYDLGKQYPDGFRRNGAVKEILGGPNRTIRSFLSGLKTRRMHDQLQENTWKYQQSFRGDHHGKWQYPGTSQDQLFPADYRHKHYHQHPDATCLCADCHYSRDAVCDKALDLSCRKLGCMGSLIQRNRLSADSPRPCVHFGSMASADTVMKSGEHRDALAAREKVIGFEMEGAGIWDSLPCIIIKGVCDYADSHKNKIMQNYAAATAASCAKAFLISWASSVSEPLERLAVVYEGEGDDAYQETLSDGQRKELLNMLRFDQIDARQMSLKGAQGKTCRWMLQSRRYKEWLDSGKLEKHNGFLWIKGKPGAGKSIMMKFLFQEAKRVMKNAVVISFFFNARGDALERSTNGMYRSLLFNLLSRMSDLMPCLDHCGTNSLNTIRNSGWQSEMLKEVFRLVVGRLRDRRVVCYVDALDECPEDDIRDMVSLFEELGAREKASELLVCFSSRHYPEITIRTGLQLVLEKEHEHGDDIRLYIESQLKIENTPQADEIKAEISRKSSGIFLWVALVVPILNKEHDRGRTKALKRRLDEIPAGLHDLFLDILTRDSKDIDEMVLCIQFILFSKRPLSPQELQVAVLTGSENQLQDPLIESEVTGEVLRKFILDVSKGLAEITKSKAPTVQFIHESVRDFLLKEGGMKKLANRESNIEGESHAQFARVCLLQLGADLKSHGGRAGYARVAFDENQAQTILSKFPFVEYAANNIIHHANTAQRLGVSQTSFLENLVVDKWIPLYNTFQKHSTHRYSRETHRLYILSEQGAEALIRIHPDRSRHLELMAGGRFRYPLLAALYSGGKAAARALLGVDTSEDTYSDTAEQQSIEAPRKMKLDALFKSSRSFLSYISEFGDTALLRKILETGEYKRAEVHWRSAVRMTTSPASTLSYAASEAVVELLMEFGPDIGLFYNTSQHDVVTNTNAVIGNGTSSNSRFQHLIERWPSLLGQTFLEYAAERGFDRLTSAALRHAPQTVDERNSQGQTLFSLAAQGRTNHTGRLAVMKILHEAQGDPNTADNSGKTALHNAVLTPFNDDIIQFLAVSCEVDMEHKDHTGHTALALAVQKSRKGYAQLLVAAGANPTTRLPDGTPVLTYCVKMGYMGIFSLLYNDRRCEYDATDSNGRTALSWCATVGDETAAKMMSMLLISDTVNPNARDSEDRTALERAIRSAQPEMVMMLCLSTKSLDITTRKGINVLTLVVALCREQNCREFHEMARLLLGYGHISDDWRKGVQDLLRDCEAYGLEEMSRMIRAFLEGGDLGPRLVEYSSVVKGFKVLSTLSE
ncbi:hypothetical protein ASPVEDRAFT_35146 [Aspergillus versicolor CBS 583.65]|uniref:Nephrocystin 3-like N-terminal domain-containing protein n=1 Tax=Aspergillus versicolor CBS 583.65 TaxID=1036611 RepID=A0A1L9P2T0_ASPVE|nr:uncharacterized protein ASPVEDRAFT_35146 [Aspergillus versicolor CBS 583.65]OJI95835.1 hypothetical protein ASPVEDRAFT_35146 [Aspergillus versicolor CBS 583.65]